MLGRLVVALISLYQRTLSPDHGLLRVFGGACRYHPTCSEYTKQAVERFGAARGLLLGVARVGRCHPFSSGGIDPIPNQLTR